MPKRDEKPMMGQITSKDYVKANIIEAPLAAPKRVEDAQVDYLKKPDFGQVPEYLGKIKTEIAEEEKQKRDAEEAKNR